MTVPIADRRVVRGLDVRDAPLFAPVRRFQVDWSLV